MINNSDERIYHVVYGPHITEKAVSAGDSNIHAFKVNVTASKGAIKKAIENLFEVKVEDVRTVNVKGKTKSFGRRAGKRKDWKKAYVRLAEGQTLEVGVEG